MEPTMLPLESWSRVAPFGARFRDTATDRFVTDGLRLEAYPAGDTRFRPSVGSVNKSGVYFLRDLPGLRDTEFGEGDDAYWAGVPRVNYRIGISDAAGRYLPFWLDIALPVRGLIGVAESASPPDAPTDIPVFSAPARAAPDICGVLRAELRESASGAPAAWALLKALIDGIEVATGLADAQGRVALIFPYPEPKRPPLSSPPPAISEPVWNVELQAYYLPQNPVPRQPELNTVLAQLAHPRRLLDTLSPPTELPLQTLGYHREVIVRSQAASVPPSPYLFIETA